MKKFTLLLTVILATTFAVFAQSTDPIVTGYTALDGTWGKFDNTGFENLIDNNIYSEWQSARPNTDFFAMFYSNEAIIPTGYILTTTRSNLFQPFPGCNPKDWTIKAKLNYDDEWTLLTTVTNDTVLKNQPYTDFEFSISNDQPYRYFLFEISALHSNVLLAINELRFRGQTVSYSSYIKDVMLVGGSKDEVNGLINHYKKQGWLVFDQDLNKGCGSSSDWIYLLHKDELQPNNLNNGFISDFYIWKSDASAPSTRVYNGHNYTLVPYDGGNHFKNVKGDLNSNAGGADIHLYYTKEIFPNHHNVTSIHFDNNKNGALGAEGSSEGYDLNKGAGGDYIYMHFSTDWAAGEQPVASLDICEGGYGEITIGGSAYDPDSPSESIGIHIEIYLSDDITLYKECDTVANLPNHGFHLTIPHISIGNYIVKVYAIDFNGNGNPLIGGTQHVNITSAPTIVTIGNAFIDNYTPFSYDRDYSLTEQIYPATEIQTAGTITAIAFDYAPFANYQTFSMKGVKMYMQHTDKEFFENKDDVIPVDTNGLVYEGDFSIIGPGWLLIDLDTPFSYNGNSNLLISIYDTVEGSLGGFGYRFNCHINHGRTLVFQSNETMPDLNHLDEFPGHRECIDNGNDIQIHITPNCLPKPSNLCLSVCNEQEATFTWDAPETTENVMGYEWQFRLFGGEWTNTVSTNDKTVSLDGLISNTDYEFRVRAIYNDSESVYACLGFRTAIELPYECGFENGFDEMSVFNFDYSHGGIKDWYPHDGNNSLLIKHFNTQYLISPSLPSTSAITASFYYRSQGIMDEMIQVGYSTTDNEVGSFIWLDNIFIKDENWELYSKDFPIGTRYIAIQYENGYIGVYLDDFNFEITSPYNKPSNLTYSNITDTSVDINWTIQNSSELVGYTYQIRHKNDMVWSNSTFIHSKSITLNDLTPNTTYYFRVKAVYSGNNSSNYITISFLTEGTAENLPLSQGFENGMGGWRIVDGNATTGITTDIAGVYSGRHGFEFRPENYSQFLISPQLNGNSKLEITFSYSNYNSYSATFQVGFSTTTKNTEDFFWNAPTTYSEWGWRQFTTVFPEGTKYIAIKWVNSMILYIDNILITETDLSAIINVAAAHNWSNPDLPIDGWNFIASPIVENITPTDVNGLVYSENDMPCVNSMYYDLYRLNNTTWENFKAHQNGFVLENGKGYLFATAVNTTIKFIGNTYEGDTKTVNISQGYNLVGNPFFVDAYIDRPYYKMNAAGTDIEAVTDYINNPIPEFTGVVVEASGDNETVTFTREAPSLAAPNNGSLQLTLTQTNVRSDAVQDKAIVSFNEDTQLEKFIFNDDHAKLYIPKDGKDYAIASAGKSGVIPVNFKASKNGEYTLTISETLHSPLYLPPVGEGLRRSTLHLIDNLTGADIDLLATPSYTFTGKAGDYASRFKLVFTTDDDEMNDDDFAFISNGELIVNGTGTLQVFDVLGHELVHKVLSTPHSSLHTPHLHVGVYVLRLINGEKVRTQKIVIE